MPASLFNLNNSMNSGNQGAPIAIIGGMLIALYVASSILMDEGNQLAGLFFYMLVASGVLGVIAPRLSFFLFVFECGYLDLFKRLMVFAGSITFTDLFWVLGIAPVTVAGITLGLMARMLFGRIGADAGDVRRLIMAVLINLVMGLLTFAKGGGIGGTAREMANSSSYTLLLFIVPLLFRTPEEVVKCTRFILFMFVPVLAYTIYQRLFGFQEFEIEYLKTGLSIEIKQLEATRVRAFGTLNSPTSVSVVASSIAAMAYGLFKISGRDRKLGIGLPAMIILGVLGVGAWAASTVRVGVLLIPVALIGTMVFSSPGKTRVFYAVLVTAFITLVVSSSFLYGNIESWTQAIATMVGGDSYLTEMLNMNSYKDRLNGFSNVLMNPDAYTMFGMPNGVEDANGVVHDPLSAALLNYGVIPLAFIMVCVLIFMKRLHGLVFGIEDRTRQLLAAAFLANAAGNIVVSIVNGSLIGTFPVNVFLWVSFAFVLSLRHADERIAAAAARSKEAPKPARVINPLHGRLAGAHRFSPR